MAITYFPFDAGAGANVTEAQWTKMAEHWLSTGVIYSQLNGFEVFADSSGMQVKVKSGKAWIKGHYVESDAQETVAIAAADPSNPRYDAVVLRLDWTANTIALAVVTGTPAGSPTVPALTQTTAIWELGLAYILVDAGASTIAAGKVLDSRTYAKPRGRQSQVVLVASGTQALSGGGTWDDVTWNTEEVDMLDGSTAGMWSSGATITIQVGGTYLVTWSLPAAYVGSGYLVFSRLVKGASTVMQYGKASENETDDATVGAAILPNLVAGNTLKIQASQATGTTRSLAATRRICVVRVSD